jgi:hypothetical protein
VRIANVTLGALQGKIMPSRRLLLAVAALLLCPLVSVRAGSDVYAIDAHVISAGNSVQAKSSCFRMDAVIAEPVAGFSLSTDFTLNAGFVAVAAPASDAIFFAGFEDCTP